MRVRVSEELEVYSDMTRAASASVRPAISKCQVKMNMDDVTLLFIAAKLYSQKRLTAGQ